jgi:hypothetical protein
MNVIDRCNDWLVGHRLDDRLAFTFVKPYIIVVSYILAWST